MAKPNKRNGKKPGGNPLPRGGQDQGKNQGKDLRQKVQDINDAHGEILSKATESDMNVMTDDPKPEGANIESLWQIVRETRDLSIAAEKRLTDQTNKLAEETNNLAQDQLTCKTEKSLLEERYQQQLEQKTILDDREKDLNDREHSLLDRENSMIERELNAEAGFLTQRKKVSAIFDEAVEQYREELKELLKQIAEQRTTWLKERTTESEQWNQTMAAEKQALDNDRLIFEQKKRELDFAEQNIAQQREHLKEHINKLLSIEREEQTYQIQDLERRLYELQKQREEQDAKLREREQADHQFGQRSPMQVLEEINRLRDENQILRNELDARPDMQAAARLQQLVTEREQWQTDRWELQQKMEEQGQLLKRNQIAAMEIENLRDQKTAAESRIILLRHATEELRSEIDGLIGRNEEKQAFPACSSMDEDLALKTPKAMVNDIPDLQAFVTEIQQHIAYDPQYPRQRLYYSLEDLRCFLGGLAMGQIILLQGISGTGKTSLPVAFARAMGTKETCELIEVQAGWRDPQDLMGHYNAFEKKFYEQKFLKALYRAQTSRWKDAIHIVVLDEMNLSHPEQYFSDLLATLEKSPDSRYIELMTHTVESAPKLFKEGNNLLVPENIWFVGTANHDETTKDFADKTYDRSLVMEFPHRPERFDVTPAKPRDPISYSALQSAFENAQTKHQGATQEVSAFLNSAVRDLLQRHFQIGWGPRLNRQLERFVPVVIAAGGTVAEVADHILATRLLRKLKNRHDNQGAHLATLRNRILEKWPLLGGDPNPKKSDQLLRSELQRAGYPVEDNL
jgi:hypothetical protein